MTTPAYAMYPDKCVGRVQVTIKLKKSHTNKHNVTAYEDTNNLEKNSIS